MNGRAVVAYLVGSAADSDYQRRAIREYADAHDLRIVAERSDPLRRGDGFQAALSAIDEGEADGVLVWDLRRVAKTTRDLESIATDRRFIVSVIGDIDTSRPEGIYLATIAGRLIHDDPPRPLRLRIA